MKLLGTVREFQGMQNKCIVMECDDCILCKVGTCELYGTMDYMDKLCKIDPDLETIIEI